MGTIQKAIDFAVGIANDNSHGYAQDNRGGKPDYDCSSLVITSWETAGVKVKAAGATYTGNMKAAFLKCNFSEVISAVDIKTGKGLQAGDVLLREGHHTALYIGNGKIAHASINEKGKISGGKVGDQTGKEICIRSYYNSTWNSILRYNEPIKPTIQKWVKPSNCTLTDKDFISICDKIESTKRYSHVQGIVDGIYSSTHTYKDSWLRSEAK